jgi:hypothetical protein
MKWSNTALRDRNKRNLVNTKAVTTLTQLEDNNNSSNSRNTTVDKGISFHLVEWAKTKLANGIWLYQATMK